MYIAYTVGHVVLSDAMLMHNGQRYTPSKTVALSQCLDSVFMSLYPNCQVVLLSGHLDSWDVGQGAMDDGGGAMISWEALSLIKDLGNIYRSV